MSRRYRFIIAGAVAAVLVAIGGIAVAEAGGQSGDHRQNPTTTTGKPAPTQPTITEAPKVPGPEDGVENDGANEDNPNAALCHALHSGSPQGQAMKAEHGRAFQPDGPHHLQCPPQGDVAPAAGGDEGDGGGEPQGQNQGGPPPWANGGNGGGNGGGGNPHAAAAPGRNK
jgi:hypothetical protein